MGEDKFETLKNQYKYQTPGEALFFNGNGHKATRLEVPDIGVEFTDGAYIGTGTLRRRPFATCSSRADLCYLDPSGVLFYNYRDHFDKGDSVNYRVLREINPSDGKVLAHIKFFTEDETLCHAEFLAYDPQETVRGASMENHKNPGNWQTLTLGSVTANISKLDDSRTINITIKPLNKSANWADKNKLTSGTEALHGKAVNVDGTLHFKDINTISKGKYASYNNDRVVFYENDWSGKDFTAFFIPFESSLRSLEVQASASAVYENISWS